VVVPPEQIQKRAQDIKNNGISKESSAQNPVRSRARKRARAMWLHAWLIKHPEHITCQCHVAPCLVD
jgi:hypothetical protein